MSDDMIERAARVMKDRCGILIAESFWQVAAQAAIEAIREPTMEMCLAARAAETVHEAKEIWQAMIDAALTSSSPLPR